MAIFIVGGVNWFVDPYDIFNAPRIAGFNANKPEIDGHERIYKALMLRRLKPRTVLLGTSCTAIGMDPFNRNFGGRAVYNCAVPAGLPEEYGVYIDTAIEKGATHVIIGLDFFVFYAINTIEAGFGDFNSVNHLLSLDACKSSMRTIASKLKTPYLDNGRKDPLGIRYDLEKNGGYRKQFHEFFRNRFPLLRAAPFSRNHAVHWEAFMRILDRAHATGLDVTLFISPSHALLWEKIDATHGWGQIEEFKRKLVEANERAAERHGKHPFALWDFSGYGELTMEMPHDDPEIAMTWYWDPVHYKKELGDIVLDRMFGGNFSGGNKYADFGVQMTRENIESHLAKLRSGRSRWRTSRFALFMQPDALPIR